MTLVIGIDEAGYGPNLGPLVIGSSSWQIDELQCDHLSTEVADQFIQLQNDIHDNYRAGRDHLGVIQKKYSLAKV